MKLNDRTILVCDCGGSVPLDGAALARACGAEEAPVVSQQLCRAQIDRFRRAVRNGGAVLVGCTQEAPLFAELAGEDEEESGADGAAVGFVDLRDRAGWSDDAQNALPKMAALLAEAALDIPPTGSLTLRSEGVCLIYGTDERALEAARQLAPHLDLTVSVLLTRPQSVAPPRVMDVPVFTGTIAAATGWLGAFDLRVDGHAAALPTARGALAFEPGRDGVSWRCDLILDLSGGTPLFPDPARRDGYFRPDPDNPAAVQKALFDLTELVGEFDKPLYVAVDSALCAHGRNTRTGCTRCLDVCPTGAVTSAGDWVAIDPHVCAGCGSCTSVCPTGAVRYALPPAATVLERLRTLVSIYRKAGGVTPVLLVHDQRHGDAVIAAMARHGRGLPAHVLPFAVNEVTQLGFDTFATALAYGVTHIRVLLGPMNHGELAGLTDQIALTEAVCAGLGHGPGRIEVIDAVDPDTVEAALYGLTPETLPAGPLFLPMGGKRTIIQMALRQLHKTAPAPVDVLPLPAGAPFGSVVVDAAGCTLCLSCVGACPTGALRDNPDKPALSFVQESCVQCGLCRITCPEKVVTLVPQLDFTDAARRPRLIKEEEPFHCIRCDQPFGTRASVERIVGQLAGKHPMFAVGPAADRLRMCEDCRVIDQIEREQHPFALGEPRRPRTTDDYRSESE